MNDRKTILLVVCIALWLPCILLVSSIGGCQSGTSGLFRPLSPQAEHTLTNGVVFVTRGAGEIAPAPFGAAIEAGGAAVLALLAAWQGLTHAKVKAMKTTQARNRKDSQE